MVAGLSTKMVQALKINDFRIFARYYNGTGKVAQYAADVEREYRKFNEAGV